MRYCIKGCNKLRFKTAIGLKITKCLAKAFKNVLSKIVLDCLNIYSLSPCIIKIFSKGGETKSKNNFCISLARLNNFKKFTWTPKGGSRGSRMICVFKLKSLLSKMFRQFIYNMASLRGKTHVLQIGCILNVLNYLNITP